jgi:hypothetical protein
MRPSKGVQPNVKILKEVSFSAELARLSLKPPEKVIVTQVNRERRIYSMDTSTKQSDRGEVAHDPYNNSGTRQLSVIPFIRLNKGVTLKEYQSGGKESILKGTSFLEHDESYRNFIQRS